MRRAVRFRRRTPVERCNAYRHHPELTIAAARLPVWLAEDIEDQPNHEEVGTGQF